MNQPWGLLHAAAPVPEGKIEVDFSDLVLYTVESVENDLPPAPRVSSLLRVE